MTNPSDPLVLIVEDEGAQLEILAYNLGSEGFRLASAGDGEEALLMSDEMQPDLIILDWMLPNISGVEVCRRLKANSKTNTIPIIMLTARGEESDRVRGLETGADDYIVKPFSAGEFLARVKALLRRKKVQEKITIVKGKPFIRGKFRVDFTSGEVSVGDKLIKLTPGEFKLLYHLVMSEGQSLSNETLIEKVWGPEKKTDTEYFRLCVKGLKDKLENQPGNPTMILDEGETGYRFVSA